MFYVESLLFDNPDDVHFEAQQGEVCEKKLVFVCLLLFIPSIINGLLLCLLLSLFMYVVQVALMNQIP